MGSLGDTGTPSLAGWGFKPGKEDPAKINGSQAVRPGNKHVSHWLPVMSLPANNNLRMQKAAPGPGPSCGAGTAVGAATQMTVTRLRLGRAGAGLSLTLASGVSE